jgi:hypothetical protein
MKTRILTWLARKLFGYAQDDSESVRRRLWGGKDATLSKYEWNALGAKPKKSCHAGTLR